MDHRNPLRRLRAWIRLAARRTLLGPETRRRLARRRRLTRAKAVLYEATGLPTGFLEEFVPAPALEAGLAHFWSYWSAGECELALESLQELGEEHEAPAAFYRLLKERAESLGLEERASRLAATADRREEDAERYASERELLEAARRALDEAAPSTETSPALDEYRFWLTRDHEFAAGELEAAAGPGAPLAFWRALRLAAEAIDLQPLAARCAAREGATLQGDDLAH